MRLHEFLSTNLCKCVGAVQAHVCQKKESHSKCCECVWERGSTLSHSAGGKLLSFSFGRLICISCHPLFSLFSFFFPPAARQQERNWENPAQGCCLPAQLRPKDLDDPYGAVALIGATFSLTFLKFGTHLKGKQHREKQQFEYCQS